jgi:hypothetical protein
MHTPRPRRAYGQNCGLTRVNSAKYALRISVIIACIELSRRHARIVPNTIVRVYFRNQQSRRVLELDTRVLGRLLETYHYRLTNERIHELRSSGMHVPPSSSARSRIEERPKDAPFRSEFRPRPSSVISTRTVLASSSSASSTEQLRAPAWRTTSVKASCVIR